MKLLQIVLIFILCLIQGTRAGNFLIIPQPATSHCLEMAGIAVELIKRNHTVTAYVPESFPTSNCLGKTKVKVITFKEEPTLFQTRISLENDVVTSSFSGKVATNNLTVMGLLFQMGVDMCESALTDTNKLRYLKAQNIDVMLFDSMPGTHCMLYLSSYLKAESVMVGSLIFPGFDAGPTQTHTLPFLLSPYTSPMSLHQRVLNTLMVIGMGRLMNLLTTYIYVVDKDKLKGSLPPEVLDVDISYKSRHLALYIENTMDVLDYPRAVYPNFIRVGGLTARPAQPLSKDLDTFFSKAKKGVIVVSFGSMLTKAPPSFFERMVKLFNNLEQSVVMSYHIDDVHGNVKTMSWLPQNDVLAHNNTVLFVSHCGKNGFNEGFYHAVPILCTPFHGDQFSNGYKARKMKIGSSISLINSKDEEIISVINEILNDKSIYNNIKRLSAIYHDDKFTPQQKAANALEHVLKFGGDHLRPVSSDFNFLSENMIDIWFVIFLFVFLYLYITYRIMKCCCRCLCKKQDIKSKKKKE